MITLPPGRSKWESSAAAVVGGKSVAGPARRGATSGRMPACYEAEERGMMTIPRLLEPVGSDFDSLARTVTDCRGCLCPWAR